MNYAPRPQINRGGCSSTIAYVLLAVILLAGVLGGVIVVSCGVFAKAVSDVEVPSAAPAPAPVHTAAPKRKGQ